MPCINQYSASRAAWNAKKQAEEDRAELLRAFAVIWRLLVAPALTFLGRIFLGLFLIVVVGPIVGLICCPIAVYGVLVSDIPPKPRSSLELMTLAAREREQHDLV
jgi:hypothetical protein